MGLKSPTSLAQPDPVPSWNSEPAVYRRFPVVAGQRPSNFSVVACQSVLNEIYRHAHQTSDVEVCGVLVGLPCTDEQGSFLYVDGAIPGLHAQGQATTVKFTSETWTHVHEVLERHYPRRRIVGWYHTHPGFGVFLSGMDLFVHRNFFNLPWQVALVYDPLRGDEGVFSWDNDQIKPLDLLIHDNAIRVKPVISQKLFRPVPPEEEECTPHSSPGCIDRLRSWLMGVRSNQS